MRNLSRYKQNLKIVGNRVISYTTHVATIKGSELIIHGYWSATTSKHINYVAEELGLTKTKGPRKEEETPQRDNNFNTVGMIAMMGQFFGETKKESNDWKKRMIQAGLGDAIHIPEDWDTLTEEEKEKRLNKVIEVMREE